MDSAASTTDEFSTKLRQRVTEYLVSEGWRVGAPRTAQGVQWVLLANDDKGRPISVLQESDALRPTERVSISLF